MMDGSKVVWAEGIFLGQQHLQLMDRYWEDGLQCLARMLHPMAWGIHSLEVDEAALENGRYRLLACEAILPDGRMLRYRAGGGEAPGLALHGDEMDVFLGLARTRAVAGINGYHSDGRLCAWKARYAEVEDEHDPSRRREVLLGDPNPLLLDGQGGHEQFSILHLARVRHRGDGRYAVDEAHCPPALRLAAVPWLAAMPGRLAELLRARARSLGDTPAVARLGRGDALHGDHAGFLLWQEIAGLRARLEHLDAHPELHPERLYELLTESLARLEPLQDVPPPGSLPAYRQDAIGPVFRELEQRLRGLLELSTSAPSASLELTESGPGIRALEALDPALLTGHALYLAVGTEGEGEWTADFERLVKLGALADVELIVASALPGVAIRHAPRPPSRLAVRADREYFRIYPGGSFWDRLVEARSIGVFLPEQFAAARLELVALQEDG